MGTVLALDLLKKPEKYPIPPFCVVFGDEAFLKSEVVRVLRSEVLADEDADFSLTRFDGATATYKDVLRETSTLAMFGSDRRLVLVEQADAFLAQNKERLETYVDEPGKAGVLVLTLSSFPSNLRLYKKASASGLIVDCRAPSSKLIPSWLIDRAKRERGVELSREGAETLVELVGDDLGALDQETQRLALLTSDKKIGVDLIKEQAVAQRQRKVWDLVDAALDGNAAEALRQLDKLLAAGEVPIAILAQMAATLRKLSAACRLVAEGERAGIPIGTSSAFDRVGVKPFLKTKYAEQLKRLGPERGVRLSRALLDTDSALKGGSRVDPRYILERFIVQISNPQLR